MSEESAPMVDSENSNSVNQGHVVAPPPSQQQGIRVGVGMLAVGALLAVILGFLGGVVSHSLFPAPAGAQGKQGEPGRPGVPGPPGSAANVNLSTLGVCFQENFDSTSSVVTSVSIYSPTITNGTQSCPSGTFVPVQGSSG